MDPTQKYFWACILQDGSSHFEYHPDGTMNYYPDISEEIRNNTIYFGLTSHRDAYFFDLQTGELHYRDAKFDEKHQIDLPVGWQAMPMRITGSILTGEKCKFYQHKEGHTDFNLAFQTSGNVIDKHVIGYTITKTIGPRAYFIDVKLSLDPNTIPVKPNLEVTLKGQEDGPVIGVYSINI